MLADGLQVPAALLGVFQMKAMSRFILGFFLISLVTFLPCRLMGQADTGGLRGQVTDPSGALVPGATVTLTGNAKAGFSAQSTAGGAYVLKGVPAGQYTLKVTAKGFETLREQGISVVAGHTLEHNVALSIATNQEQVAVTDEANHVDVSSDANASQMVIKGSNLDALSDDPDELSNELSALAGPSAGPNGGQIFIDGFSGGQLPPKSSIREIRVNQNPFAAQYDKLGYGRIEILTKPGTDKLHGTFMVNGNDSSLNALNPVVKSEPAYYSTFMMGNLGGSLTKKSSFFVSVFRRNEQENAIVNATVADKSGNASSFTSSYANPMTRLDVSPRIDLQMTNNNTLTVRGMFRRSDEKNGGVGDLALIDQAYNSNGASNGFQLSDSQIINNSTVDETLFEYRRVTSNQHALNTTPEITVPGSFTGGGNSEGKQDDTLDRYELQNYVSYLHGRHSFKFGTRLRATRDENTSTSGFNGTYTYNTLSDYVKNSPSQYTITSGAPTSRVTAFDGALYADDEFHIKPTFTLSYGVRYEAQNHMTDWRAVAPRLSIAWGVNKGRTVIRGGYGWFYDRFDSEYTLEALRNNGVTQATTVKSYSGKSDNSASTVYDVASSLLAPVTMEAAAGVEQQITRGTMLSATYINSRGVHALLTDNINAPQINGVPSATGTRPNPKAGNIYQYQSNGIFKQNELVLNYTVAVKKISLFGFYMLNFANGDTQGASSSPSNPYKISDDWGRSSFDVRSRFLLGGSIPLYYGVSFSPMMDFNSGSPFNITTGSDNNGDSVYNDRPAKLNVTTCTTSGSIYSTKLGCFDTNPSATAKRVAINYGTGPSSFSINGRLSKRFAIGPKVQGGPGGGVGPGGGGPPPGGGMGGGLGPGGLGGNHGGPHFDQGAVNRKFALNFAMMVHNIMNTRNMAAPVGVVTSSNFDKSIAIAGGFFGSASSNRSIDMQVSFSF
jgi:hypothetical protein